MAAVLLACAAGALYGAVTAALGLAVRRNRDAEAGALATIVVVFGVREAGSAGVAPLLAAVIAVAAFDEPVLVPVVSGTLLIVLGGAMLAWEPERPAGFRLSSGRCSSPGSSSGGAR